MGTWDISLKGNDAFLDIYQGFYSLYNEGTRPEVASTRIQADYQEAFLDKDDAHESLFGLALAQWETKSLDPAVFAKVREIIESGKGLEKWKEEGMDEKTLKQRQAVLEEFLRTISVEREKAKRRVRQKNEFTWIVLAKEMAPDRKKFFELNENYCNGKYLHTTLNMTFTASWSTSGIMGVNLQGKFISVHWIDNRTLEVRYDKELHRYMYPKWEQWYESSDPEGGTVIYIPQ